jgi:hypothetical protein
MDAAGKSIHNWYTHPEHLIQITERWSKTCLHKLASSRGLVAKRMQRLKVFCPTAAAGSVGGGTTGDVAWHTCDRAQRSLRVDLRGADRVEGELLGRLLQSDLGAKP